MSPSGGSGFDIPSSLHSLIACGIRFTIPFGRNPRGLLCVFQPYWQTSCRWGYFRSTFGMFLIPFMESNFPVFQGVVVSTSWDETIRIWNLRDGSSKKLTNNTDWSCSVRFSPNGQYIQSVLSLADHIPMTPTRHICPVWSVVFTPDGRGLVRGSHDGVGILGSLSLVENL